MVARQAKGERAASGVDGGGAPGPVQATRKKGAATRAASVRVGVCDMAVGDLLG